MHVLITGIHSAYGDLWQETARFVGNGGIQAIIIISVFAIGWYLQRKGIKRCAVASLTALAISGITVQLIKFATGRARPCLELSPWTFRPWASANNWHSFPSGHAASSFAIATVLSACYPRLWWLWLGVAAFVGMGRIIGESHYPTDVIAGALIGGLCGVFALHLVKRFYK